MEQYPNITFGEYEGTPIDEIPMEYLTWMFSKLYFRPSQRELYKTILDYFLSRDVRVEGGQFYFNDHKVIDVEGTEQPFMISMVLTNSKSKEVYVVGNSNEPIFLEEVDGKFEVISGKYEAVNYMYSGNKMYIERTPDFWFYDNQGLVMTNSFLMKLPVLPKGLDIEFSNNLLTKDK